MTARGYRTRPLLPSAGPAPSPRAASRPNLKPPVSPLDGTGVPAASTWAPWLKKDDAQSKPEAAGAAEPRPTLSNAGTLVTPARKPKSSTAGASTLDRLTSPRSATSSESPRGAGYYGSGDRPRATLEAVNRRENFLQESGYRPPRRDRIADWSIDMSSVKANLPQELHRAKLQHFWKLGRAVPERYEPPRPAQSDGDHQRSYRNSSSSPRRR